ncbi:MAG: NCS2 family permease [Firmicutes bacterium]|nr:NCS2 family permease [Bacillota bacterium]
MQKTALWLENYFHLSKHNTTVRSEILAAITNYFTLLYLLSLVPEVIVGSFPDVIDANGELIRSAVLFNGVTAGQFLTALTAAAFWAAGIGSIIMGLTVNMPFIQGPSLAIAAFVVYTVCHNFGYTYYQAIAIIFLSGIVFFLLSVTGAEEKIHKAIPRNLKYAVTAGIGMFITYTGLQKAHILSFDSGSLVIFDMLSVYSHDTRTAWLAIFGVILITILLDKHVHGAVFIGKIVCIVLAVPLGLLHFGQKVNIFDIPFSAVLFKPDFSGLITGETFNEKLFSLSTLLIIIFAICVMDIFETMSMLLATRHLLRKENARIAERTPRILEVDAVNTSIGALLGVTNVSTYIESTAGIIEGARTGLTAVITGILFIITSLTAPLAGFVPSAATATTLIISGVLMMNVINDVDFDKPTEAVPAVFTIILMPLTGSLLTGIAFGIIIYVMIHIFTGRGHKINYVVYILALLLAIFLIFLPRVGS